MVRHDSCQVSQGFFYLLCILEFFDDHGHFLPCVRYQLRPSTERWAQRQREGRVRDTWGPRFQSVEKQDKELRSALGYVMSGDAIVGWKDLWYGVNVN